MIAISGIGELRLTLARLRAGGARAGLVPTMGALHEGHLRLIARAREECQIVVVSLFVNPTQFDRRADFDHYPRTMDADLEMCRAAGVDVVFAPTAEEMYPEPPGVTVEPGPVATHLCGKFRPGHFKGVATVVAKLFNIVRPEAAYFGEKDFQQLALIRQMARDLSMGIGIRAVETVREADGLAMSSRNRRLKADQRRAAAVIYRALCAAREAIAKGERDAGAVLAEARRVFASEPGIAVEYLEVVGAEDIQPVERIQGEVRVAVAAWAGETRLIDNVGARPGVP
jgi:pantoate--beta-alanine ligase